MGAVLRRAIEVSYDRERKMGDQREYSILLLAACTMVAACNTYAK
jgi:hypothetical protein